MKAVITGITGQDGSYLAEFLLEKNYEVIGLIRRSSTPNFKNIKHIKDKLTLIQGDITDSNSTDTLASFRPDEFYNLAAQSHVGTSFKCPKYTHEVNYVGFVNCLESLLKFSPSTRVFQASTSEMFGNHHILKPLDENSPFSPVSPYSIAKLSAHHLAEMNRKNGMYVACGITFNHESPRRGDHFVTKKIVNWLKSPRKEKLKLGNLDTYRDWGYAKEYVEAFWRMLQLAKADTFVIATGRSHSLEDFLDFSFRYYDLDWRNHVEISEEFKRPHDVTRLLGIPNKIKAVCGWEAKTSLKDLIRIMLQW